MTHHDDTNTTAPPGINRRRFLVHGGLAIGAGVLPAASFEAPPSPARRLDPVGWEAVRGEFALTPDLIQMAGFFLASHPWPVREAIERHRRGLDANPIGYYHEQNDRLIADVLRAAGDYLGADPRAIALTDSTTMGLGLLYGGLALRAGQEILTTTHDHYATSASLRLRAERTGAAVRAIPLYDDPATASRDGVVAALAAAVRPETRVVAITWVHSGTGVKLPVRDLADALGAINAGRAETERALLCVDGVHGLGVEDVAMADLGCDFFVAGCHKWLFGPRGTGLIWGASGAWPATAATIPTFDAGAYERLGGGGPPVGAAMTPGGFHSFEHRWALTEAFRFHLGIGKAAVAARVHGLNRQLKEGLAGLRHIRLRTPLAAELSAGIVCFEVDGLPPEAVVAGLRERRIVASVTPYATRYARLAPSLLTSPAEVEETLRAVRALAGA